MSWALLYLLMLKATLTSFNGPMSLPVLRNELVVQRHVLSDRQLNAAVTTAQSAPGPMGIYVVSVGFFVGGLPGAFAGYLALITPAFLMIPLVRYIGHRVEQPRLSATLDAAVLASAGLIFTSAGPLAREAINNWFHAAVAVAAFLLVAATRLATVWILLAAGIAGALTKLLGGNF